MITMYVTKSFSFNSAKIFSFPSHQLMKGKKVSKRGPVSKVWSRTTFKAITLMERVNLFVAEHHKNLVVVAT